MGSLKILSWNMQGRDLNWRWLVEEADFDIAFLQEATYPTGFEDNFTTIIHHPKKKLAWGTAIVSKSIKLEPFNNLTFGYWGYKMKGSLTIAHTIGDNPIWFASMHCGHKALNGREFVRNPLEGLHLDGKTPVKEITVISHLLSRKLVGKKFIVGGDLNISLLHDESRGGKASQKQLNLLAEVGLLDIRKKFLEQEMQSFFKAGSKPSQLDHLFADQALLESAINWEVMTEVVTDRQLSDHAPIVAHFMNADGPT